MLGLQQGLRLLYLEAVNFSSILLQNWGMYKEKDVMFLINYMKYFVRSLYDFVLLMLLIIIIVPAEIEVSMCTGLMLQLRINALLYQRCFILWTYKSENLQIQNKSYFLETTRSLVFSRRNFFLSFQRAIPNQPRNLKGQAA